MNWPCSNYSGLILINRIIRSYDEFMKDFHTIFHSSWTIVLLNNNAGFIFLYSCQHLVLLYNNWPNSGFDLHFVMITGIEHFFMCSWPFAYHVVIKRMCAQIICLFLGLLGVFVRVCVCVVNLKNSLCILDINSLPYTWLKHVLVLWFTFCWLLASFVAQKALFWFTLVYLFVSHCLHFFCLPRNHGQLQCPEAVYYFF